MRARRLWIVPAAAAIVAAAVGQLAVAVEALAQTDCPRSATTGKSIALTAAGGRRSEIAWLDATRVRISEQNPGSRTYPRQTIAVRGLVGIEMTRPSGKVALKFDTPLDALFPLSIGKQLQFAYSATADGQPPIKARMTIAAVEPLKHTVGPCAYDAVLVGSMIEFEGGSQAPVRYDVYIPALQAVVKSTTFDAATNTILEAESFEYDALAAK